MQITTYSSTRKNAFTWLAAVCMTLSAAARIAFFAAVGAEGFMVMLVRMLLPLCAALIYGFQVLVRGEKQFYVTRGPVFLFTVYFAFALADLSLSLAIYLLCLLLCAVLCIMYELTYIGRIRSRLPVLAVFTASAAYIACSSRTMPLIRTLWTAARYKLISDTAIVLGIISAIISSRALPEPAEGEDYRMRPGDRRDGRLIRTRTGQELVIPFIMPDRIGSSNWIEDSVEITNMERYIHEKRREGYKHFGILHVILAAYVRTCAELPGLNRFCSGQRTYHRNELVVSMVVKKEMAVNQPDTTIKVHFEPADTAAEVYEKYNDTLQSVKGEALDSDFDKLVACFNMIPRLLLRLVVDLLNLLEYFGLIPRLLYELSPFHASMFITSMGSLGIPPIWHHLYDFGNVPVFCSFGAKRSQREIDQDGNIVTRKYLDYTFVTDERICDGFYYASVLKRMRSYMTHPERLDVPPEKVIEDID